MNFKIKICGNVNESDSMFVADFQPDYMGWIFSPASPRRLRPQTAGGIIRSIRRRYPNIKHVGVFARNTVTDILEIANAAGELDHLQIVENAGFLDSLRGILARKGAPRQDYLIPAIRVRSPLTDSSLTKYGQPPFYILDSYVSGQPGGTGKQLESKYIKPINRPYLLAGGLNPENVQAALKLLNPLGVDISSGLEDSIPGQKNRIKVESFFKNIRNLT